MRSLARSSESTCLLCMGFKHHVMRYSPAPDSGDPLELVFIKRYFDSTAMFTVSIHGLLRHSSKYLVIPL